MRPPLQNSTMHATTQACFPGERLREFFCLLLRLEFIWLKNIGCHINSNFFQKELKMYLFHHKSYSECDFLILALKVTKSRLPRALFKSLFVFKKSAADHLNGAAAHCADRAWAAPFWAACAGDLLYRWAAASIAVWWQAAPSTASLWRRTSCSVESEGPSKEFLGPSNVRPPVFGDAFAGWSSSDTFQATQV